MKSATHQPSSADKKHETTALQPSSAETPSSNTDTPPATVSVIDVFPQELTRLRQVSIESSGAPSVPEEATPSAFLSSLPASSDPTTTTRRASTVSSTGPASPLNILLADSPPASVAAFSFMHGTNQPSAQPPATKQEEPKEKKGQEQAQTPSYKQ